MRTLEDQLAQYAEYHRDRRNIATHFVGVPMIVVAVAILLSRPAMSLGGWTVSLAWPVIALAAGFYLRLDGRLGALMTLLLLGCGAIGQWAAAQSTMLWLVLGVGGFVVGWIIQFIGHIWEGRKPAFVDDLVGLLVGPLFVTVELLFRAGRLGGLRETIEARVGPERVGRPAGQVRAGA